MATRKGTTGRSARSTTSRTANKATGTRGTRAAGGKSKTQASSARASSGRPGGGAGRRERVGGSGVYPASGPMPPDNAPVRPMAGWGQGDRGAEGYSDSGRSELYVLPSDTTPGGQNRGRGSRAGRRKTRSAKTAKRR